MISQNSQEARAEAAKALLSLMLAVSVGFWAKELKQYVTQDVTGVDSATLFSGVAFLADILCIAWWYANYIYRIQPVSTFENYFLDFLICSMFALGANSWTEPKPFVAATCIGSSLLIGRFWILYKSPSASQKDRGILRTGLLVLVVASLLAFGMAGLLFILQIGFSHRWWPGTLAMIGVGLTIYLRRRIDVAAEAAIGGHPPTAALPLLWPREPHQGAIDRTRIRRNAGEGLQDFLDLFKASGKHIRVKSRVHPDTDLLVQSYILAIPSASNEHHAQEIRRKAFMAAASHWLDDLVDGREDIRTWRVIRNRSIDPDPDSFEPLFDDIYRSLVKKHTDVAFFEALKHDHFEASCGLPVNQPWMYQGLIRVAYGAVMFSPRIDEHHRREVLADHNAFLIRWNPEGGRVSNRVEGLLDKMAGDEVGDKLLGLTTKTVQELAMASEGVQLNVSVSILMSILFAPLLYYHDFLDELAAREIVPMGSFDSDCDRWIDWLAEARGILEAVVSRSNDGGTGPTYQDDEDERIELRRAQLEMAFLCFQDRIPSLPREALRPLYCRSEPVLQFKRGHSVGQGMVGGE